MSIIENMSGEEAKGILFISYSHKDEKWMKELTTFLKVMQIHSELDDWVDTDISAGEEWYSRIDMIDDRNRLGHIYSEKEFKAIIKKFPGYGKVFEQIDKIISSRASTQRR